MAHFSLSYFPGREGKKHEWALIEPKLEGDIFTFKVDNGEGILAGEMKLKRECLKEDGKWLEVS